jgi:hypothetical protein
MGERAEAKVIAGPPELTTTPKQTATVSQNDLGRNPGDGGVERGIDTGGLVTKAVVFGLVDPVGACRYLVRGER